MQYAYHRHKAHFMIITHHDGTEKAKIVLSGGANGPLPTLYGSVDRPGLLLVLMGGCPWSWTGGSIPTSNAGATDEKDSVDGIEISDCANRWYTSDRATGTLKSCSFYFDCQQWQLHVNHAIGGHWTRQDGGSSVVERSKHLGGFFSQWCVDRNAELIQAAETHNEELSLYCQIFL